MSHTGKEDTLKSAMREDDILELQSIGDADVSDVSDHEALQKKIVQKNGSSLLKLLAGKNPQPILPNDKTYPYLTASWFSWITFSWVNEIIKKGYLRRIEDEDLYKMDKDFRVQEMTERFEINFDKRKSKFREKNNGSTDYNKWVVIFALNDTFKGRFWGVGAISKVLMDLSQMLSPLLVRALVKYIQEKSTHDPGVGHAIGYAIGISAMLMFTSLSLSTFFHSTMITGGQVKAVLTNVIYKKAFTVSPKARFEFPNGKINSLVMTDLSRIDLAVGVFHFIWTFPISFSVGIIVLCCSLGPTALIGIAAIFLFLLSVFWFNTKLKKLRIKSTVFIDKRVHAINEIVNNLKMIKLYSWEAPYNTRIEEYRSKEKGFILNIQLLKAVLNSGIGSITGLATMLTFIALFYTSGGHFLSYNIFSAITLFNMLKQPLNLLPMATSFAVDALIAMERVAKFLQAEDGENTIQRLPLQDSDNAIEIVNGNFKWDLEQQVQHELTPKKTNGTAESLLDLSFPGLTDINMTIKRGELILITGSIGTGKTSLLNSIDGGMRKESGESRVYGSLTFCSYPWVQNATIRENILFGMQWDPVKYDAVVRACGLDVDFKILPGGDEIEVGERGITLSGGQKSRINLARAVYADRDIILLDDVLSAVDANVGRHIMDECICGLLKDKTRLLATHQLSLIGAADRVIILDGSGSLEVGPQAELMARSQAFANLMAYSNDSSEEEKEKQKEQEEEEAKELERVQTQISMKEKEGRKPEAVTAEQRSSKSISWRTYVNYLILGSPTLGPFVVPLFLFIITSNGFLQIFHSVWLSFWLSDKFDYSSQLYTGIYVLLVMLASCSFFVLYGTMASLNNTAGLRLFNLSSTRLLKTPMWFMDITPLGRILNRFTKDVDVLDTDLIEQLRLFITSVSMVGATIILCACYIPWFLIAVPIAFFFYYYLFTYYKTSALDIKRLEATKRSFVFSHFNESLSGMKVIKSFSSADRFKKRYEELIDDMNAAYFLTFGNQRWLSIRLDMISSLMALFVSIMCVCNVFHISGSSAGLLVSYIVQVSGLMSLLLRAMTMVENDMNSVERLFEYALELPQEGPFEIEDKKPEESWPQEGAVTFNNVSLSYRQGLPLVLKNVSFETKAGEKIGVCGRTGAGKSTIMNALFRVSPLAEGRITIDGIDTSTIGLRDLRSKLSIIPQDPVLFYGTVRQNLDPFGASTDAELWDALRRSWLVEEGAKGTGEYKLGDTNIFTLHKFHLDQMVEDDGANFSLGERQLLALARALVRDSKILILDEATSSVDYETDVKIQSTIVNEFKQCTILCIAHRLRTILNYDRILVLDKGEVVEFDTPYNLFQQGGIFAGMCARAEITDFRELSN
jgi:ABC-type multidrug transport system fused ATPase/permease subunit